LAAEMYHIELIDVDGRQVLRRTSMRSSSIEAVRDRALAIFRRSQMTGVRSRVTRGVRVLDGAGHELFSASVHD
jgi:hypothetical protein